MNEKAEGWQNLQDYQKISVHVTMNKTAQYEDNMVYKFQAAWKWKTVSNHDGVIWNGWLVLVG